MTFDRTYQRVIATAMYDRWVKCPTTGRILDVLRGDDKVLCNCGTSNPRVPAESTDRTGTHIVRFCDPATLDQWLDQEERDQERRELERGRD